ncbi:MAG: universal stress protein [Pseudomonadota bacterium]
MYKRIMVPVDLNQTDKLAGALSMAGQMAEMCGGELIYAGVHGGAPSEVAHDKDEYAQKLDAFADAQPFAKIVKVSSLPIYSHDPAVEIATGLVKAASEHKIDLIVMASHVPGWAEHVFHSNAGYVASHAPVSVFVVR